MKKFIAVLAVFLVGLVNSYGEGGSLDENCGCGLGVMLFEGQDGVLSQTLAVTTNGIFMNQLFGITSGTLGCEGADSFVAVERLNIFVAGNMDNLAKEIAMGKGEVLNTLAEMMDIPDSKRDLLFGNLRANFSNIYESDSVTNQQVVQNILEFVNS